MTFFDIFILSAVEGLTEFLPISSTGHLIIVSEWLNIDSGVFSSSFNIAIQLGAILAIVALYWRALFFNRAVFYRLVLAFLPTAILGFIFYPVIKNYLLHNQIVVMAMFFAGGVALIAFEYWHRESVDSLTDIAHLSLRSALIVGLFQSIALIPGVSRSAATILGGLFLGLKRQTIVEFSFLLAVPTMLAATGYDLFKNAPTFTSGEISDLALGFVLSFIFAFLAVKLLLAYISRYSFIPFGIYRIVFAGLLFILIFVI